MSKYYNIKGLKVRVSDHEPNERLNGSNDIELYTRSVDGLKLNIKNQIERVLSSKLALENNLTMSDFNEVLGKKSNSALSAHKAIVDGWFSNPDANAELISDLRKHIDCFIHVNLNKKQSESLKLYIQSKLN